MARPAARFFSVGFAANRRLQPFYRIDRYCPPRAGEKNLDPACVHSAELIYAVRLPDPAADAAARRAIQGLTGAAKIGDLVAETGHQGQGFRTIVRLIRSHAIPSLDRRHRDPRLRRSALAYLLALNWPAGRRNGRTVHAPHRDGAALPE